MGLEREARGSELSMKLAVGVVKGGKRALQISVREVAHFQWIAMIGSGRVKRGLWEEDISL